MTYRHVAMAALLAIGGLVASENDALACSCAPSDQHTVIAQSDIAFVGHATDMMSAPNGNHVYRVVVDRPIKGTSAGAHMSILVDALTSCAFSVPLNTAQMFVFDRPADGPARMGFCRYLAANSNR